MGLQAGCLSYIKEITASGGDTFVLKIKFPFDNYICDYIVTSFTFTADMCLFPTDFNLSLLVYSFNLNKKIKFVCFCFCCFTSHVNSYGHCGTASSINRTFSWASLNKQLTSNRAHTFACN